MNTKKIEYTPTIKFIQWALLAVLFFYADYFANRGATHYITAILRVDANANYIIALMAVTAMFKALLTFPFLKMFYNISLGIYQSLHRKYITDFRQLKLLSFPIELNAFVYSVIWFILLHNIIMGSIRLIYFYYPFFFKFFEAFMPIIISLTLMLSYFLRVKKKYLDDNNYGKVFIAMAIPYLIILLLFM